MPAPTAARTPLGVLLALAGWGLVALAAAPPTADPALAEAEAVLAQARVGTDGASLLAFLRARTVTEAERDRLARLVPALGADEFAVREQASRDLVAAGNIGCLTQLAGGGIPVVHTVELLDWMAGGPAPEGIAQLLDRRGLEAETRAA